MESDWRVFSLSQQDLFTNAVDFLKLEKIEYTGIKGKILSAQTFQLFEEFNELYKEFQEVTYDCLDPQDEVCQATWSICDLHHWITNYY